MPNIKQRPRKQRHKRLVSSSSPAIVAAAVSIPEPLYLSALNVAEKTTEGNFSRYVRGLITADLKKSA